MFARLTRFASMPLPLTNGIARLFDGPTVPKVAQGEDGGAAALPTASPPQTGPWKDEMTACDPFLGSALPREDFMEMAGVDFGAWDTSEGMSWYERPMALVNHVQMNSGEAFKPEVSSGKSLSSLMEPIIPDVGFPSDCFSTWHESYQPGFFDDLELQDLSLGSLDDLYNIKLDPLGHPDNIKVEPYDEGFADSVVGFPKDLLDPVREELVVPEDVKPDLYELNGQPLALQFSGGAGVRKRPARNCKRRSALELLNPEEFHPVSKKIHTPVIKKEHAIKEELVVLKEEEIDLKPNIAPPMGSTFGKTRGVKYKPCFNEAEYRRRAMNRTSAKKYRVKKRLQKLALTRERKALEVKNADLRKEAELLQRNIDDFRRLLGF